jgi:PAS domain S-box-containing protein
MADNTDRPETKTRTEPEETSFSKEVTNELGQFIFSNLPIGIFRSTTEPSGCFLLANPSLVKMFNYDNMEEFLKTPVWNTYWNPDDRKLLLKKLLSHGFVNREIFKMKKKNGDFFWGAIIGKLKIDSSGKPIHFDGAIEDITQSKENELRLQEERNFSEGIIEALPGMFWLNDEDGKCVRWNKNVEAIYGYTPDEIRRLDAIKDITSSESLPALEEATRNALNGGSGYCEYDSVSKFGKKIALAGDSRLITINNKKYLACVELDITRRKEAEEKLREALDEIKHLKEITDAENVYLMDEINSESSSDFIVGRSSKLNQMLHIAKKVAPTSTTVLIQGETGTGKGLLAHYIHSKSPRHMRPLIKLNCANLPATLIESILFGHEKGAFTSASTSKIGRFELANNSTIFLDEIAELPLELQSKLLRVIEEGEFERLGGSKTISVDVRIIAATNRNLEEEVKAGNFRQDLLFRLNVYPVTTPPLRERKSDIPLLTQFFINKFNKSIGKSITEIPTPVIEHFEQYTWPGNIRELQNVIERAVINSTGKTIKLSNFALIPETNISSQETGQKTLQEVEHDHILHTLDKVGWVIEGKSGAASVLGLNPSTLRGRMRKLGIQRPGRVTQF